MSYAEDLKLMEKFIPPAVDKLFAERAEIMLSLDASQVVEAVISSLRLSHPRITDRKTAYTAVESAFAELLANGKLPAKSFGFSILGAESARGLIQKHIESTEPAPHSPAEEFADVVSDFQYLPMADIAQKRKDPIWRDRFEKAVAAGLIS
jgi:hypothetical protein